MAEVAVNIMFGQCEQRSHSLYKNLKLLPIEIQIVIQMQGYIESKEPASEMFKNFEKKWNSILGFLSNAF